MKPPNIFVVLKDLPQDCGNSSAVAWFYCEDEADSLADKLNVSSSYSYYYRVEEVPAGTKGLYSRLCTV